MSEEYHTYPIWGGGGGLQSQLAYAPSSVRLARLVECAHPRVWGWSQAQLPDKGEWGKMCWAAKIESHPADEVHHIPHQTNQFNET